MTAPTHAISAIRILFASVASLALAGPALAEDDRPSEMPYEVSGEFPTLDINYRRGDHEVVIIKDGALQPQTPNARVAQATRTRRDDLTRTSSMLENASAGLGWRSGW